MYVGPVDSAQHEAALHVCTCWGIDLEGGCHCRPTRIEALDVYVRSSLVKPSWTIIGHLAPSWCTKAAARKVWLSFLGFDRSIVYLSQVLQWSLSPRSPPWLECRCPCPLKGHHQLLLQGHPSYAAGIC